MRLQRIWLSLLLVDNRLILSHQRNQHHTLTLIFIYYMWENTLDMKGRFKKTEDLSGKWLKHQQMRTIIEQPSGALKIPVWSYSEGHCRFSKVFWVTEPRPQHVCCLWENDYWVWKFISNSVNQYHSVLSPSIILSENIVKWGNSLHVSTLL